MRTKRIRTIAAGLAGLVALGGLAGMAARFTSSATTADQTINTADGSIELPAGQLTTTETIDDFVPGDWASRTVDVKNAASFDFESATVYVTASDAGSLNLVDDTTDGLQVEIKACDQAWTASGDDWTCAGAESTIQASEPLLTHDSSNKLELIGKTGVTLDAGETTHLRIKVALPETADNNFKNKSTTITYTFESDQRDGMAR